MERQGAEFSGHGEGRRAGMRAEVVGRMGERDHAARAAALRDREAGRITAQPQMFDQLDVPAGHAVAGARGSDETAHLFARGLAERPRGGFEGEAGGRFLVNAVALFDSTELHELVRRERDRAGGDLRAPCYRRNAARVTAKQPDLPGRFSLRHAIRRVGHARTDDPDGFH